MEEEEKVVRKEKGKGEKGRKTREMQGREDGGKEGRWEGLN